MVWGRDPQKAQKVADSLVDLPCEVVVVQDLQSASAKADVVACATLSTSPLIQASWIQPGTHVDLVGSFTPHMREADAELFRGSKLVVDTSTALKESGDLLEPQRLGYIPAPVVELADVVRGTAAVRSTAADVTVFKSVGTGLSDIAAARHFVIRAKAQEAQTASCKLKSGAVA